MSASSPLWLDSSNVKLRWINVNFVFRVSTKFQCFSPVSFFQDSVRHLLSSYLFRFSTLAGPVITCGPVLNWFELDNRGRRLIVTDDGAINTPAVAAAYAVRRYAKQAPDEISFEVRENQSRE
jgi:hypothetical protein